MQTTTSQFTARAKSNMRPLSWSIKASFDKQFDDSVTFFVLDQSILDGPDILAPSDNDVIQSWDKYTYTDYSSKIIGFEWTRQEDSPWSVNVAMADIVFDNHDNFFTPNGGSPIQDYILPWRPFRVLAGFGGENLPQFVGLSERVPTINKSSREARFHCIDFLSSLFSKKLNEAVMLEDKTTDEVLDYLFQLVGLLPGQYVLDTGQNFIPFTYFEKNTTLGTAVDQLMEAEMGRLYMDELGTIRFKNRYNSSEDIVYYFDDSNVINFDISDQTRIINNVEVTAAPRIVQTLQPIWQLSTPVFIANTDSVDIFTDFSDPVTSASTPVNGYTSNDSYFVANTAADGSGSDITSGVSVTNLDLFSTAAKITFTNSSGSDVYLTEIDFWGTPAKQVTTVRVTENNQASIDKYDEQTVTINNPFIQDASAAQALALVMIYYYKDYGSELIMEVKGSTALQMGDAVHLNLDGAVGTYIITKIVNSYVGAKFKQVLTVRKQIIAVFFTLDQSVLDGTDVLGI